MFFCLVVGHAEAATAGQKFWDNAFRTFGLSEGAKNFAFAKPETAEAVQTTLSANGEAARVLHYLAAQFDNSREYWTFVDTNWAQIQRYSLTGIIAALEIAKVVFTREGAVRELVRRSSVFGLRSSTYAHIFITDEHQNWAEGMTKPIVDALAKQIAAHDFAVPDADTVRAYVERFLPPLLDETMRPRALTLQLDSSNPVPWQRARERLKFAMLLNRYRYSEVLKPATAAKFRQWKSDNEHLITSSSKVAGHDAWMNEMEAFLAALDRVARAPALPSVRGLPFTLCKALVLASR